MRLPATALLRLGHLLLLAGLLGGCTRFQDHASLSLSSRSDNTWTLSWTTVAKRGVNLVDSSGNVGSASASFPCRPDPHRPLVWLVNGPAAS